MPNLIVYDVINPIAHNTKPNMLHIAAKEHHATKDGCVKPVYFIIVIVVPMKMTGNGQSKGRCNKDGSAKKISTWRLLYLSSGENDLSDCENESKKKTKAGQLIRLINIPAVHNEKSKGAFDDLHDKSDGKELAEYLSSATNAHYGAASRGFIEYLIKEGKEAIKEGFNNYKKQFICDNLPEGADSQIRRAINKFALVAYAGELATANGFTGWDGEEAKKAAFICFNDWIKERGGISNQEKQDLLKRVKLFFEQHSNSRFLDLSYDSSRTVNNMAGYKKEIDESVEYWVFTETFNNEICGVVKDVKRILFEKGWLKSIQSEIRFKINTLGNHKYLEVKYTCSGETMAYPITLEITKPNYGGIRWWFKCPGCGERVANLYIKKRFFWCRKCNNLSYRSQQYSFYDRMRLMSDKYERIATENGQK